MYVCSFFSVYLLHSQLIVTRWLRSQSLLDHTYKAELCFTNSNQSHISQNTWVSVVRHCSTMVMNTGCRDTRPVGTHTVISLMDAGEWVYQSFSVHFIYKKKTIAFTFLRIVVRVKKKKNHKYEAECLPHNKARMLNICHHYCLCHGYFTFVFSETKEKYHYC